MPWARLDDNFHDHPKVDGLSLAAVGAYTLCLTWAHRHRKTAPVPGHIPVARVRKLAPRNATKLADELLESGLWEQADTALGGYIIHDFAEYLPKERDPEERAQAGRKGARRRWQTDGKPDGNLPAASQTPADSKLPSTPMANDGSRVSARAFPNPTRTQGDDHYVPSPNPTQDTDQPSSSSAVSDARDDDHDLPPWVARIAAAGDSR